MKKIIQRFSLKNFWNIDRVARLLNGLFQTPLVLLGIYHHANWLFLVLLINAWLIISSLSNKCFFHWLLKTVGFYEREEIYRQKLPHE